MNGFTIWTEIDGIERFPTEKQFLSYCRLVPGADNSGGRTRHRSGSKAGNRCRKLAFGHASVRAIQYFPVIKRFYHQPRRRKPVVVARAIVAAELWRTAGHALDWGARRRATRRI